jgi:hypothetical protein
VPIRGDGKCTACRGKGVWDCRICADGITTCLVCLGRAPAPRPCPDCGGTTEHRCNGCVSAGDRPWELRVRALLAAGEDERARTWANEARVRCRMRFQSAFDARPPEVGDDFGPRLEAERDAELARLDALVPEAGATR